MNKPIFLNELGLAVWRHKENKILFAERSYDWCDRIIVLDETDGRRTIVYDDRFSTFDLSDWIPLTQKEFDGKFMIAKRKTVVWTIEERNAVALEAAIIKEQQPHIGLLNLMNLAQSSLPEDRRRKIKCLKNVPYLLETLSSLMQQQTALKKPEEFTSPQEAKITAASHLYFLHCFLVDEQKRRWVAQNDTEYCLVDDRNDPNTVSFEQKEDAIELLKTIHFAKKPKFNENQYIIFARKCKNNALLQKEIA